MSEATGDRTTEGGLATTLTSYRIAVTEDVDALVTQVIAAALQRGAELKEKVERQAQELLDDLAARRDELEREIERLREERRQATAELERLRRQAREEAEAVRAAAERDAATIRADAERYADELTAQARDRRAALLTELAALEAQVARARERVAALAELQSRLFDRPGLASREVIARLEAAHALSAEPVTATTAAPAAEPTAAKPATEPPAEPTAASAAAEAARPAEPGAAPVGPAEPERPAPAAEIEPAAPAVPSARTAAAEAAAGGAQAEAGPRVVRVEQVPGYATALAIEAAVRGLRGVREVVVRSFHRGTLTLEVDAEAWVDLPVAITSLAGLGLQFRGREDGTLEFAVAGLGVPARA